MLESIVKYLLPLAAGALFWLDGTTDAAKIASIAGVLASVSGTLFGFLLTAIAIVVSLPDKQLIGNMKITGHYSSLLASAYEACAVLFGVLVLSVTTTFLDGDYSRYALLPTVVFAVLAMVIAVTTGFKLSMVIKNIN